MIKIKNINTKVLSTALAFTLLTTPLMGCSGSKLKYEQDASGNIVCVENIKYNYLKEYRVLILGKGKDIYFYISKLKPMDGYRPHENCYGYYDVFGGNFIYSNIAENGFKMVSDYEINDYLISYDMIKDEYSEQDLKKLLENIENDFNKKIQKQKTK